MDLHSAVSPVISSVNPNTPAQLFKSTGSATGTNGKQAPAYAPVANGDVQVQALSGRQLQHINNLGINGVLRKIYLHGDWQSTVRSALTGGDKFVFTSAGVTNGTWLVVQVLETWPDWCCVAVQLQVIP